VRALLTGVEKFGAYKTVQRPLLDAAGSPPRTLQRRRATRAHEG